MTKPFGITVPQFFDRLRIRWTFGLTLRRVWFADHRSGWSGLKLGFHFGPWLFEPTVIRWRTPPQTWENRQPVKTLAQQIRETHGPIPDDDE